MKKDTQLVHIPNALAFTDYLVKIKKGSILLLNVDNFSIINDTYDFDIGDKVLVEISKLLNIVKPPKSKLFRMNSDEFTIVSEDAKDVDELILIASSIISFFDQIDVVVDDISMNLSLSIGMAEGSSDELLKHAKIALLELRQHAKAAYNFYNTKSNFIKTQEKNLYWVDKIKKAFYDEKLIVYYQPIINNTTKKIEKYECLIRILEDGVLIPPIRLMEAFKLTGTLSLVTKTVIKESFKKFSDNKYDFSINITCADFYQRDLKAYLIRYSQKYHINPSRVILEILEDIHTLNTDEIMSQLYSLRQSGFKIAIDDFGNDSSNLSRLLEFSPDYLKIDGSFIQNILTDKNSLIIVEMIILLCKRSNIKMIAEFVHSKEIQKKIEELGIEYSQGFYFSEPKASIG